MSMPSTNNVSKRVAGYSVAGTAGSLFIGYGLREFLRAAGGGYYCCNHAQYLGFGIVLIFIGWSILLLAAVNFHRDLTVQ